MHPAASRDLPGSTSKSLRTAAVIPARYDSTRLPGKVLAEIAGRPMIEHVYRRAVQADGIDIVLVATDDPRIAAVVEGFGGAARLTAKEHRTGTDRIAEVAASLDCDVIVNVQADEPLIDPRMIGQVAAPFLGNGALRMTTLRRPIDDPADYTDPGVVKVVSDLSGHALYFSRSPLPGRFGPMTALQAHRHVGLYAYRREFLLLLASLPQTPLERAESLEQLRALEHGYRILTLDTEFDSIGVDTPEDLERVRRLHPDAQPVHAGEGAAGRPRTRGASDRTT